MKKSILIADDDVEIVELLSCRCQKLGFEVDSASNAMTALGKIEENQPDVVILDVDMPQGNGLSVCEMMASHEELRATPVIMLTGSTSDDTVRRCFQMCAYYVLKSPNVWARIEPVLQELFPTESLHVVGTSGHSDSDERDRCCESLFQSDIMDTVFTVLGVEEGESLLEEEPQGHEFRSDRPWVLSIEDDDDVALALRLRLQEIGVRVVRAAAGMAGYRQAFLDSPQAIILDYELPQGKGDYVLRRLKETPATCNIPVIVLTGRHEAAIERQMRNLGASEFLTKPLDWNRLRLALQVNLDEYQAESKPPCPEKNLA